MALGCFLFGLSFCYVSFVTYSEVFDCRALDAWTHGSTNMCMWPSNGEGVDESAHNRLVVQGLHARAVVAHTELPRDPRRYARADVHVLGRRGGNEGFPMLLGLPRYAVAGGGVVSCATVRGCEQPGPVGAPWLPHGLAYVTGPSPVCFALGRPSLHVPAGFDSGGSPAAARGASASLIAGAGTPPGPAGCCVGRRLDEPYVGRGRDACTLGSSASGAASEGQLPIGGLCESRRRGPDRGRYPRGRSSTPVTDPSPWLRRFRGGRPQPCSSPIVGCLSQGRRRSDTSRSNVTELTRLWCFLEGFGCWSTASGFTTFGCSSGQSQYGVGLASGPSTANTSGGAGRRRGLLSPSPSSCRWGGVV